MSASMFYVKEHTVPCSHIREDFATTSNRDDPWQMSIKQYIPLDNQSPAEGDVTIIAGHGNGFIKELYEPFWDDLYHQLKSKGLSIRAIWFADAANMGPASKHLNKSLLQDSVSSWDHSRDLLHMINIFRFEIVQPIVGIGHSIGASQLAILSLLHPTLFSSLVLFDPIIVPSPEMGNAKPLSSFAIRRPNEWPTRAQAEAYFKKAFGRSWDVRVLKRWNEHSLEAVQLADFTGPTRLSWARVQEVTTYLQFPHIFGEANEAKGEQIWVSQPPQLFQLIENMSVRTLIICGIKSETAGPALREIWAKNMCTNPAFQKRGRERRVEVATVDNTGHLLTMEKPGVCAEMAANWIGEELPDWKRANLEATKRWRKLTDEEREKKSQEWICELKAKL